jgi:hypothetical protein
MSVDTQLELLGKRPEGEPVEFKMPARKKLKIVLIKSLFFVLFALVFVGSFFLRQFFNVYLAEASPMSNSTVLASDNSKIVQETSSPFLTGNLTHLVPV